MQRVGAQDRVAAYRPCCTEPLMRTASRSRVSLSAGQEHHTTEVPHRLWGWLKLVCSVATCGLLRTWLLFSTSHWLACWQAANMEAANMCLPVCSCTCFGIQIDCWCWCFAFQWMWCQHFQKTRCQWWGRWGGPWRADTIALGSLLGPGGDGAVSSRVWCQCERAGRRRNAYTLCHVFSVPFSPSAAKLFPMHSPTATWTKIHPNSPTFPLPCGRLDSSWEACRQGLRALALSWLSPAFGTWRQTAFVAGKFFYHR